MTTDENLSMTPDNDKAPQRRKRPRKGPIVGILLLLFLLAGIGAGAWWYLFLRFEESTDDAYVAGNVLRIMPQVSGKVVAVDVDERLLDESGKLCLNKAKLIVYSHGDYLALGRKLGSFGYSVRKKKKIVKK